MNDKPTPQLGWKHISLDVIGEAVHCHVQEAVEYRGLRSVWTLDTVTGERRTRFFIRVNQYETLNEAIAAWKRLNPKKRVRL